METVQSVQYFRKMAKGWRLLSLFGLAFVNKNAINFLTAPLYAPAMGALLRKHYSSAKENLFDIQDEKKSYFYIDTSQYMNYTNRDL